MCCQPTELIFFFFFFINFPFSPPPPLSHTELKAAFLQAKRKAIDSTLGDGTSATTHNWIASDADKTGKSYFGGVPSTDFEKACMPRLERITRSQRKKRAEISQSFVIVDRHRGYHARNQLDKPVKLEDWKRTWDRFRQVAWWLGWPHFIISWLTVLFLLGGHSTWETPRHPGYCQRFSRHQLGQIGGVSYAVITLVHFLSYHIIFFFFV